MALLIDNPIIIKHIRARLRPAQAMPGAVALFCLAATLTWLAFASQPADGQGGGFVFGLLLCLLALVLVVLGSEQVATAVSVARETGILDFHRISPLPPAEVALGFFLGAPIREACYAALLVPFLAATAILAGIPWTSLFDLVATVVFVALLVHAWQLLAALVSRRPRASTRGILLLVFLALGFGASAMRDGSVASISAPTYFGLPLPRALFVGLHTVAATIFLLVAATRQMRDQRAALLSKWQALACLTTVATLAVGSLWTAEPTIALVALLTVVVATGVFCGMPVAVTTGEYLKGVRRARRLGRSAAPPLDDAAASGVAVAGLCLVAVAAAAILGLRLAADWQAWAWPFSIGLLVIATHGFARQYYRLRDGSQGDLLCNLTLFLIWVLPLPLAAAWSASGLDGWTGNFLWEVTPWAGMTQAVIAKAGGAVGGPWPSLFVTGLTTLVFGVLQVRQAAIARREAGAPGPV
ncbi:MAG: hypothetical protein NT171_20385 [Planctomycetota bacterium]|jgi:hypothetical protein|nr:hypothetical protein [Planctomycetota bacterium]